MNYTNSPLVTYTKYSPNFTAGRKSIERITLHCVVGHATVESIGALFAKRTRMASSNYSVDDAGHIGLHVDEKNRSWCSSSADNDSRAITCEIASDNYHPFAMTDKAYKTAIELCVDICRRYGKKRLIWIPDKTKALSYTPAADEMLLTVHRWFASKACPGDWLFSRLGEVAETVTARLGSSTSAPAVVFRPYKVRISISDLNIRREPDYRAESRGFTGMGIFTIVDESSGWGLLKAYEKGRDGWVKLSYTERV